MAETVKSFSCIFPVNQSTFLLVFRKITAWVIVSVSYKSQSVSSFHSWRNKVWISYFTLLRKDHLKIQNCTSKVWATNFRVRKSFLYQKIQGLYRRIHADVIVYIFAHLHTALHKEGSTLDTNWLQAAKELENLSTWWNF